LRPISLQLPFLSPVQVDQHQPMSTPCLLVCMKRFMRLGEPSSMNTVCLHGPALLAGVPRGRISNSLTY
jgi:hypothetical protein